MKKLTVFAWIWVITLTLTASNLKPGFDKQEYLTMLGHFVRQGDSLRRDYKIPLPDHEKLVYRSKVMGLDNRWFMWVNGDSTVTLSVRGTVATQSSWLENAFLSMTPANGTITPEAGFSFSYHLADNPRAAVHSGWLIGMAYLQRDMLPKIDSLTALGYHNFIVSGHSQGGALSYLLTSHFYYLQRAGRFPAEVKFKTYCSAAPKPGNLYYAYDFEHITAGGWAFNVVNSADWVPEIPATVQTTADINRTSPLPMAEKAIQKQGWLKRIFINKIYRKLTEPSLEQAENNQKYLGDMVAGYIGKTLPGFVPPPPAGTFNYTRAGATVVLYADESYYSRFAEKSDNIWLHHMMEAYWYLAVKL